MLGLCTALGACVWELPQRAAPDEAPAASNTATEVRQMGGVSPQNRPLFASLAAAVEDGDEGLAEGILLRLRSRSLTNHEESLATAFERVLTGRKLVSQVVFSLRSEPLDQEERFRLVLCVENLGKVSLLLDLPPADLARFRLGVAEDGNEGSEYDNRMIDNLSGLHLEPESRREFELLEYGLPVGEFLAVRERWQLRPRSGEVYFAGEAYPAANVKVAPCERVRLRDESGQEPVRPEDLAALLQDPDELEASVLLEHAVRVPAGDREVALASVAPYVERWAYSEPERIEAVAPTLRWLSQNTRLGGEAQAWDRYLQDRLRPKTERPVLELPAQGPSTP